MNYLIRKEENKSEREKVVHKNQLRMTKLANQLTRAKLQYNNKIWNWSMQEAINTVKTQVVKRKKQFNSLLLLL